jgi:hypothetical protein
MKNQFITASQRFVMEANKNAHIPASHKFVMEANKNAHIPASHKFVMQANGVDTVKNAQEAAVKQAAEARVAQEAAVKQAAETARKAEEARKAIEAAKKAAEEKADAEELADIVKLNQLLDAEDAYEAAYEAFYDKCVADRKVELKGLNNIAVKSMIQAIEEQMLARKAEAKAEKVQDFINARTVEMNDELLDIDLDIDAMAKNLDNLLHPKQTLASNVTSKIGNAMSYLNLKSYLGGAKVDSSKAPAAPKFDTTKAALPAPLTESFVKSIENADNSSASSSSATVVKTDVVDNGQEITYPSFANASKVIVSQYSSENEVARNKLVQATHKAANTLQRKEEAAEAAKSYVESFSMLGKKWYSQDFKNANDAKLVADTEVVAARADLDKVQKSLFDFDEALEAAAPQTVSYPILTVTNASAPAMDSQDDDNDNVLTESSSSISLDDL